MAFEVIDLRMHKESLSMDFASAFWSLESQTKATFMLYTISYSHHFLSHLAGTTVKLQRETLNIVDAYSGIVSFY